MLELYSAEGESDLFDCVQPTQIRIKVNFLRVKTINFQSIQYYVHPKQINKQNIFFLLQRNHVSKIHVHNWRSFSKLRPWVERRFKFPVSRMNGTDRWIETLFIVYNIISHRLRHNNKNKRREKSQDFLALLKNVWPFHVQTFWTNLHSKWTEVTNSHAIIGFAIGAKQIYIFYCNSSSNEQWHCLLGGVFVHWQSSVRAARCPYVLLICILYLHFAVFEHFSRWHSTNVNSE